MESPPNPTDIIISALKERNLTVRRDEIESLFNESPTDNAKWVEEHLSYDTLLSEEELTLYSKLEDTGALGNITDIEATRPFLDSDIQSAIESLNASTAAVQQQTEILTLQCENLNKQLRQEDERGVGRGKDIERLRKKHESGRGNVAAETSDLVHELEMGLKGESEKATVDGKRILSSLTARLKDDDRILTGLERLASGVNTSGDDVSIIKRTGKLSAILAGYIAEEMQCRLDRLYLEGIGQGSDENAEEIAALEEELESLYPEIDVLAEMSSQQQFNEPILRELQEQHGRMREASHRKLEYILDMMTEMTASTESLTSLLQDRSTFCSTLSSLSTLYRTEASDLEQPPRRETLNLKRRSMQIPRIAPPPSHSEALGTLLRRIGLSTESVFRSEEEEGGAVALYEKRTDILETGRHLGRGADVPLTAELVSSDRAARLLASALDADSRFKTSLADVEQERRLSGLEEQLGFVQRGMDKLNLDVLYQRDKSQDKFLERWT